MARSVRIDVITSTKAKGIGALLLNGKFEKYVEDNFSTPDSNTWKNIGEDAEEWWERVTPVYWSNSKSRGYKSTGQFKKSLKHTVGKNNHALFFFMKPIYSNAVTTPSKEKSSALQLKEIAAAKKRLGSRPAMDIGSTADIIKNIKKLKSENSGPEWASSTSRKKKRNASSSWDKKMDKLDKESRRDPMRNLSGTPAGSKEKVWEYGSILRNGWGRVPKYFWEDWHAAFTKHLRKSTTIEMEKDIKFKIRRMETGLGEEQRQAKITLAKIYDNL